jgi:hypothetical protein
LCVINESMKGTSVTKTKNSLRLSLTPWEMFSHFIPVLFAFFAGMLPLWWVFEIKFLNSYDGVRSAEDLFTISWPWLVFGSILMVIQWRRLKMRKIQIDFKDKELNEAISRTAQELNWHIQTNNQRVIVASRSSNWTGSWGERVTIVKLNDGLLLNSICDPDQPASIASFGWNKRNIDIFLKNLNDVKDSIPAKKKVDKTEKEWTLKRVIVRLIAYPFCLFLIGLGGYMIFSPLNWKSKGAGIGAIGIASIYLYTDLKMILRNKNTNAQHSV